MSAIRDNNISDENPVPESLDGITQGWCEWALRKGGIIGENTTVLKADVERFKDKETGEVNDGGGLTGAKLIRIRLSYGGHTKGDEPSSVVCKIMFGCRDTTALPWRILLKLTGAWDLTSEEFWRTDIKFFRHILPIIEDKYKAPKIYYTGMTDKGNRNFFASTILNMPCRVKTVTLMEDYEDWDTLPLAKLVKSQDMDPSVAASCLKNLAVLHASFWGENNSRIKTMFTKTAFMESTFRAQAHSKIVARKRLKFGATKLNIEKGTKIMTDRWQHDPYMCLMKENKTMIPDWFTAEPLENGSWPVLKDSLVQEMLTVCAERFPSFAKDVANPQLKRPMQTLIQGDFQSGNHMYGKGSNEGKVVALDFQCVGAGTVTGEIVPFLMITVPAKYFLGLSKEYHQALVDNGVTDYSWETFKRDLIIEVVENVMKTTSDYNEYTKEKFEQMFRIFGDKAEGFKLFLEGGVPATILLLATDIYLKDKDNFLITDSFDKIF